MHEFLDLSILEQILLLETGFVQLLKDLFDRFLATLALKVELFHAVLFLIVADLVPAALQAVMLDLMNSLVELPLLLLSSST